MEKIKSVMKKIQNKQNPIESTDMLIDFENFMKKPKYMTLSSICGKQKHN
jgi:hypothetical protein